MAFVNGRIVFDLVLLALGALALRAAYQLPAGTGEVSSAFFPLAVLWLGIALMAIVLLRDVAQLRRSGTKENPTGARIGRNALACLVLVAAELVAYILVLEVVGFVLSTTFFLTAGALTCEFLLNGKGRAHLGRTIGTAAVVAVAASSICYLLFTNIFGLALP